jgi:hypothetical protein
VPEFTSDLARSGAISRPLRPRPRLGLSLFAHEPDRTRSAPFWAGLSTGRISWIAVRVRLGAQVPRAQSSGGDWSKPAASVSSSQGAEAKPDVRAGVRGGALGGRPITLENALRDRRLGDHSDHPHRLTALTFECFDTKYSLQQIRPGQATRALRTSTGERVWCRLLLGYTRRWGRPSALPGSGQNVDGFGLLATLLLGCVC